MNKLYVPKDNFDQNLVRYLFENQRTKFLHLTGLKSCPFREKSERDRREQVKNNPFHPDRMKASALTEEVPRLYAAMGPSRCGSTVW